MRLEHAAPPNGSFGYLSPLPSTKQTSTDIGNLQTPEIMKMDLTPKKSTPWWCLLKCCHPIAAKDHDEEENGVYGANSNGDVPRTPLTKQCSGETSLIICIATLFIAIFSNLTHKLTAPTKTPPTDRSTPLKPIQEDDDHSSVSSFNHFLLDNDESDSVADSRPSTPQMDFTNGIGLFLTLAAAAQQTSTIKCATKFQESGSLFDDSFDLKEVSCNVLN